MNALRLTSRLPREVAAAGPIGELGAGANPQLLVDALEFASTVFTLRKTSLAPEQNESPRTG